MNWTYTLTDEEVALAYKLRDRRIRASGWDKNETDRLGTGANDLYTALFGAAAEIAWKRGLGVPLADCDEPEDQRYDKGIDHRLNGFTVQVKYANRDDPYLKIKNRWSMDQFDNWHGEPKWLDPRSYRLNADRYVLAINGGQAPYKGKVSPRRIEFTAWVAREELEQRGRPHDFGNYGRPQWVLEEWRMEPIETFFT